MAHFGDPLPQTKSPEPVNRFVQRRAAVHALWWALYDFDQASQPRDPDILAGTALASVLAQEVTNASGLVTRNIKGWIGGEAWGQLQGWMAEAAYEPTHAARSFVSRIREDGAAEAMVRAAERDSADSAHPLTSIVGVENQAAFMRILGGMLTALLDTVSEVTGDALADARTRDAARFELATRSLQRRWLHQEPGTRLAGVFHEAWTSAAAMTVLAAGQTGVVADFQKDALRALIHHVCGVAGRLTGAPGPLAPDFLDAIDAGSLKDPVEAALDALEAMATEQDPRTIARTIDEVVPHLAPLRGVDNRVYGFPAALMGACQNLGRLTGVSWVSLQKSAKNAVLWEHAGLQEALDG